VRSGGLLQQGEHVGGADAEELAAAVDLVDAAMLQALMQPCFQLNASSLKIKAWTSI